MNMAVPLRLKTLMLGEVKKKKKSHLILFSLHLQFYFFYYYALGQNNH